MVSCLTNRKPVRVPNFSPYRKSFLYTPCNCPVEDCCFTVEEKDKDKDKQSVKGPKASRRIRKLAKPRKKTAKFHPRPVTQYGRVIQKIAAYREPYASTRIQQLAVPKVRKLLAAREEYQRFINRCMYDRFSKRIKRSMFTVYSRLANVQLPEVPPKSAKMTPEQWKRHQEWLALRAKHKVAKVRKMKPRKKARLDVLMDRIDDLAMPRKEGKKWNRKMLVYYAVKPSALKAVASTRLLELCVPLERRRRAKGPTVEKVGLPEEVLKAVASERTIELSKPKVYKNVKNEYRENPFTVEKRALKAKASDRILELAKPKPDHSKKKK